MHVWKWLHFFQGIFHKLPPSCLYIVRSSMLGYEYLAGKTFWMLKMLHSPIEWYNTEQILMKLWQAFIQTILMSVSAIRHKKPNLKWKSKALLPSTSQASDNLFLKPRQNNLLGQKSVRKLYYTKALYTCLLF